MVYRLQKGFAVCEEGAAQSVFLIVRGTVDGKPFDLQKRKPAILHKGPRGEPPSDPKFVVNILYSRELPPDVLGEPQRRPGDAYTVLLALRRERKI